MMLFKNLFRIILVSLFILSGKIASAQESTNGSDQVKGAKIEFVERDYDFGTALQNTEIKHVFKFRNVGSDTLKILEVKTSCGCTAAESSNIIPPEKEGQITVTYKTGSGQGRVAKKIYVFSNDVEASYHSLIIQGNVEPEKPGEEGE